MTEEPDGSIVLTPAVVLSELEAAFLVSPAKERLDANRADPSRLVRRRRG